MSEQVIKASSGQRIRLRPIALPREHGGWSFLLEPLLLGLLVAPSWAGVLLGQAALGAFLARHPLTLALFDRRRGKRYPRTAAAELFTLAYGTLALGGIVSALTLARQPFWLVLFAATPFALVQLWYDVKRQGRELVPELAGALALGVLAPATALAAGWNDGDAILLWGLVAARGVPAILYVRARLRRSRGEAIATWPALASHSVTLLGGVTLGLADIVPWPAVAALSMLLVRAIVGLRHPPVRAAVVGIQEVVFGLLTVVLVALGFIV